MHTKRSYEIKCKRCGRKDTSPKGEEELELTVRLRCVCSIRWANRADLGIHIHGSGIDVYTTWKYMERFCRMYRNNQNKIQINESFRGIHDP